MKKMIVILSVLAMATAAYADTIASTSFENLGSSARSDFASTDGNTLPVGTVVALPNTDDDGDTVYLNDSTSGDLGFSTVWINSQPSSYWEGISDGDYLGVTNYSSPVNGVVADGSFMYQIQDTDGTLRLTFDAVDISMYTDVSVSFDYFIDSTGYEDEDNLFAKIVVDGNDTTILDITGDDLELVAEAWLNATQNISGNSAQLIIEGTATSGSEQFFIDNVVFSGTLVPEPASALFLAIGGLFLARRRA